jgi:hypothetical protein
MSISVVVPSLPYAPKRQSLSTNSPYLKVMLIHICPLLKLLRLRPLLHNHPLHAHLNLFPNTFHPDIHVHPSHIHNSFTHLLENTYENLR